MTRNKKESRNNEAATNGADAKNTQSKKPFDKKTYRLKKYSNKYKINQWEERRKKVVLRKYYKDVLKEQKGAVKRPDHLKTDTENKDEESSSRAPSRKKSAFEAAKEEFARKKEEKQRRKEEAQRKKEEKIQALKKYKEEKALKYKKLSKKTKKGQPVMKDRLEMLLEKIQQSTS